MHYYIHPIYPSLFFALFLCSSASAQGNLETWFTQNLAQAISVIPEWHVKKPGVRFVESDYIEVLPNGSISAGRSFLKKVKSSENAIDLVQILLLHELRHIYQINNKQSADRALLECESDYFATLQYGRALLKQEHKIPPKLLIRLIRLQSVGPRLNKLSDGATQHTHLSSSQRFSIGTFAVWRAIYEKLRNSKAYSDVKFASFVAGAKSFTEPIAKSDVAWASDFCNTLTGKDSSESKGINLREIKSEFKTDLFNTAPPGFTYFNREMRVSNELDRPMRVLAWPLIGFRKKNATDDYEQYFGWQTDFIDITVPALGNATVNWREMSPDWLQMPPEEKLEDFEVFVWDNMYDPQFIMSASPSGPRVEPPNCHSKWIPPTDKNLGELFDFLKRAGMAAKRDFADVRGDEKYPNVPFLDPTYYNWSVLPILAQKEDSFIVISKDSNPSGTIFLLKSNSLSDVESEFARHSSAFRSSCAAEGVRMEERKGNDGMRRFSVNRLTMLSSLILNIRKKKDNKNPSAPPEYSLSWDVSPED